MKTAAEFIKEISASADLQRELTSIGKECAAIGDFLKKCHVFFIATDDNGQPQVRPFGAYLVIDGELYFMTGWGKPVYDQMKNNPRVAISGYYEGDWIRITGEVEFLDDPELRKAFLKASPERARMFYKMPKAARKLLLEKIPGLKNMLSAESDYMKDSWPFRLKNASAKLYSLRNETIDLSD